MGDGVGGSAAARGRRPDAEGRRRLLLALLVALLVTVAVAGPLAVQALRARGDDEPAQLE